MKINNKKDLISSFLVLSIFVVLSTVIFYNEKIGITSNNNNNNTIASSNSLTKFDKSINLFYPHDNDNNNPSLFQFMEFLSDYGWDYFWPLVVILFFIGGFKECRGKGTMDNGGNKKGKPIIIAVCIILSFSYCYSYKHHYKR